MRLLVAENDSALGIFLQRGFGAERYAVDLTQNGEQAKSLVREHEYDLAILDLSLPKEEGLAVLQHLRASRQHLPILILTNRSQVLDRVRELDMGADDFVLKPFSFSELSARVRALLRRGGRAPETVLRIEDLELNRVEHSVRRANRAIELTPKEFSLLEFLMRNSGQQVTRAQIIEHVWNLSYDTQNVIQFHHTPELAQAPAALVALVHLCDLLCRLRGMGYGYEELREVDFHESPAWSLLEKAVPHLDRLDVVRCTLELDAEADEIRALVANAFQAQ
jgi:two-component system, OmpR family, copper resistance phosphate regulon response regulator CusR